MFSKSRNPQKQQFYRFQGCVFLCIMKEEKILHMFWHLHGSALISAVIYNLQPPWMMLYLHSGPWQMFLSEPALTGGNTSFWIWISGCLKSSRQPLSEQTDRGRGMKNAQQKFLIQTINVHDCVHTHSSNAHKHRTQCKRGKEEGGGESGWIMGRENERWKNEPEKRMKEHFPTIQ